MGSPKAERTLRLILKLAQLIVSIYLIVAMYNIGPHWVLLFASLAVPLYGLFLIFRSPERTLRQHPLPFVRYKALVRARNWLRVDLAICATMAVSCLAFALVLLFGYFHEHSVNSWLLQASVAALLLSLLYSLNAMLNLRQLQMGRVDFLTEKHNASISTTRASTMSPIGDPLNFSERMAYSPNGHGQADPPITYRGPFDDSMQANQKPITPFDKSAQSPLSSIQREGPSLLEQLQRELAMEYSKGGRWRHIPIDMDSSQDADPAENHQEEEAQPEHRERTERKVRVEQRRTTREGMDLGEYGTKEEAARSWKYGGHGQTENGQIGNEPKNVEALNMPNGHQHGRRHSSLRHSRNATNVTNEAGNEGWREPPHLPRLAINRDGMISRNGRIRTEWRERDGNGTDRHQVEDSNGSGIRIAGGSTLLPPYPAAPTTTTTTASSSDENNNNNNEMLMRRNSADTSEVHETMERKRRVRYETVSTKTIVDVDRGQGQQQQQSMARANSSNRDGRAILREKKAKRDFDVSIRPRTSPFRQSTELRLRDDGREKMPATHQVTEL